MNKYEFIRKFTEGTLGSKTQYSTYWVNKFDGCNVLCHRTRRGLQVTGIYMGPEFTIFNNDNRNTHGPFVADFEDIENISESGLIDIEHCAHNREVKSILFQIGNKQYLVLPSQEQLITYNEFIDNYINIDRKIKTYGNSYSGTGAKIYKLSDKFGSVEEAQESLIPKKAGVGSFIYRNWWFIPQPEHKKTPMDSEKVAVLENPPMPWHFDLSTDLVAMIGKNSSFEYKEPFVRPLMGKEIETKYLKYKKAKKYYETLLEEKNSREFPARKEGIMLVPGKEFDMDITSEGILVKGQIAAGNAMYFEIKEIITEANEWHLMIKAGETV